MDRTAAPLRRKIGALLTTVGIVTLGLGLVAPTAGAAAGDFSIDLAAARPGTYDQGAGSGGVYGDGGNATVVESLEGGDFSCGDFVVQFAAVTVGGTDTGQTIELDLSFLAVPTGQPGVGFTNDFTASVNPADSGNIGLETTETVTLSTPVLGTTGGKAAWLVTATVTGLDFGEQLIVRTVAELGCTPATSPTGNLMTSVLAARLISPGTGAIPVGNQTIPLKQVGDIPGNSITIVKDVADREHAQDFTFTPGSTLGGGTQFTLDDDSTSLTPASTTFFNLTPGTHTVSEDVLPAGWALTSITCDDSDSTKTTGTPTSPTATIVLATGEDVTCTFVNTFTPPPPGGQVSVTKTVAGDPGFDPSAAGNEFEFDVTCTKAGETDITFLDQPVTGGGTWTSPASPTIPAGYSCTVTEDTTKLPPAGTNASWSGPTYDPQTGVIEDDEILVLGITNTRTVSAPPGGLVSVTKTVAGDPGFDPNAAGNEFEFDVICTKTGDPAIPFDDQKVKGGATWTSPASPTIPAGYSCTVTEDTTKLPPAGTNASWSAPTYNPATGVIVDGQTFALGITNTRTVTPGCVVNCSPPPPPPPAALGIDVDKTGPARAHVGDTVTYTIEVTNTGAGDLVTVVLVDPRCDAAPVRTLGDVVLNVGETWTYQCDYVVTAGDPDPLPNTATATGTAADNRTVTDDDSHSVDILNPSITILKTASAPSGNIGDVITFTYVVTNTGDASLFDVVVVDDVLGAIGTIDALPVGGSRTLTKDQVLTIDTPTTNVGTASGADALGLVVTDSDDEVISVVSPQTITMPPVTAAPEVFPEPEVVPEPEVAGVQIARPAQLPKTGDEVGRMLAVAGFVLMLGGILVMGSTRREAGVIATR